MTTQLTMNYEELIPNARERNQIMEQLESLSASLIRGLADSEQRIQSPEEAAKHMTYSMSCLEKEELRTMNLNTRNCILGVHTIYRGSLNSSQIRIGELFKPAIVEMAAAMIVFHNHPSGDPTPSPDDVAVTRAIVEAGRLLDIEILDHLVIAGGRHVSLKQRGLGFEIKEPASWYEASPIIDPEYIEIDELLGAIVAYSLAHPDSPFEDAITRLVHLIIPVISDLSDRLIAQELD